jgi:hypothetical protein
MCALQATQTIAGALHLIPGTRYVSVLISANNRLRNNRHGNVGHVQDLHCLDQLARAFGLEVGRGYKLLRKQDGVPPVSAWKEALESACKRSRLLAALEDAMLIVVANQLLERALFVRHTHHTIYPNHLPMLDVLR